MANKYYDYSTPAEYVYDSDKIEVSGGLATLKEDLSNVYAHWKLNESSGTNVPDSSGNGRNGTTINSPLWVAGKLNNCLQFNGVTQYVNCGNIAGFERNQSFSLECWVNPNTTNVSELMTKILSFAPYTGWELGLNYPTVGTLGFALYGNSNTQRIRVGTTNQVCFSGSWNHVVITYNGSSLASGIHIYVNNIDQPLTIINNNL